MRRPAVAIMAREPTLHGVKTRLSDVLSPEQRLELYRAFLTDRVDQVCALPGAAPFIAYTPPEAAAAFEELFGDRVGLLPQRGEGLSERLIGLAENLLGRGHPGVIFVDSDSPNLPFESLTEAVTGLGGPTDLVLGPAWDGGYYLLGLKAPHRALFEGISWSTSAVLAQTVAAAQHLRLRFHLLPEWYDVDTAADLERLAHDLRGTSSARPGYPHRTARVVAGLRLPRS